MKYFHIVAFKIYKGSRHMVIGNVIGKLNNLDIWKNYFF